MPFPISVTGKLTVPGSSPEALLKHFRAKLEEKGARFEESRNPGLKFRAFFPGLGALNILNSISYGRIDCTSTQPGRVAVNFYLRFTYLVVIVSILTTIFSFFVLVKQTLPGITVFHLAALWLWLVGGNYLITVVVFKRFLEEEGGLHTAARA